ncbi:hypothetical protein ILUMI_24542 [Ignelater luminosus]|uniref:Uncharacterized protein n=1 Tax=Ignelater luminosus TaxID=2038154 RepID=A0A8K0C626_IGNLU|nr:hypothetical protein ILUMI_24542 [Ignelater luminosus]
MDSEHVVGDSDRGSRKKQRNTTSKERKKEIRRCLDNTIFSDGCAGQNKNSSIVHMLMTWLHNEAPPIIKNITLYFPVRGHSYMAADRVFGRVEKLIRSHSVVKNPEKYYELYSTIALVRKLGISEAKKIVTIKRPEKKTVVVKTEIFYRNDNLGQKLVSLLKKGKKLDNIKFPEVNLVHEIKHKKLDTELQWLLAVFPPDMNNHEDTNSQSEDDDEDVHEHVCECNEDDGGIKI